MLVQIGKLGVDNADYINSIDFNPVIVYPKSHFVVDAKIILTKFFFIFYILSDLKIIMNGNYI